MYLLLYTSYVDAGGELRRREGLGHIVVRPGHEARHLVHLLGPGREHDDADLLIGGTDVAADLKAIHIRQHNIQNGNAGVWMFLQTVQRLLTGTGLNGVIPGPLQVDHHKTDALELSWTTGTNYGTGNKISYTLELTKTGSDFADSYGQQCLGSIERNSTADKSTTKATTQYLFLCQQR